MKTDTEVDVKIRPYAGEEDVPTMVDVFNAELEADGVPDLETVEDNLAYVRHPTPRFDPARDCRSPRSMDMVGRVRTASGSTPTTDCASTASTVASTRSSADAASARRCFGERAA